MPRVVQLRSGDIEFESPPASELSGSPLEVHGPPLIPCWNAAFFFHYANRVHYVTQTTQLHLRGAPWPMRSQHMGRTQLMVSFCVFCSVPVCSVAAT